MKNIETYIFENGGRYTIAKGHAFEPKFKGYVSMWNGSGWKKSSTLENARILVLIRAQTELEENVLKLQNKLKSAKKELRILNKTKLAPFKKI